MAERYMPTQSTTAPDEPRRDVREESVGSLVREVAADVSKLVRQELELAKAELKQDARRAGKATGLLSGAGVAGWLVLLFASLAAMWGLAEAMHVGWAALIVAGVWAVVAALMYVVGRRQLQQVEPVPEQTVETLKEDARWARNRTR